TQRAAGGGQGPPGPPAGHPWGDRRQRARAQHHPLHLRAREGGQAVPADAVPQVAPRRDRARAGRAPQRPQAGLRRGDAARHLPSQALSCSNPLMGESRMAASPAPVPSVGLDADRMRRLYRALLLPRLIEEKALLLLRQGRLSKWFSGMGQEAIAVGVAFALESEDWILPLHRNLGGFTTRGVDFGRLFRQLFGKDGGFTKGRDRTFHFGLLDKRIVGMISHLGAMLPVADGLALAAQLRGESRAAAVFSGDGGTSEGDFHEAANLAAVWKLPVLFVIENN